ncbi:MAG: ATP-binding cassette domain-containing protein, partial [Paenarthrobacter sp.]
TFPVRAAVVVGVLLLGALTEVAALADQHAAEVLEDQLRAGRAEAEEPDVVADGLGLSPRFSLATGVASLSGRLVDELSAGQQQRVRVAMVLAQQTPLILPDDPTTFPDIAHQIEPVPGPRLSNQLAFVAVPSTGSSH